MKNKFFLLLVFASTLKAQIKVYSGGTTVVGSLSSAGISPKFQVVGNSTFMGSVATITSAALIRGNNAYSGPSTPDYTFYDNDQVGIFHPASNILGFTVGNLESFRIHSSGNILMGGTSDWGSKLQVACWGNVAAFETWVNHTSNYSYAMLCHANLTLTKAFSVMYNGYDKFLVYGSGDTYAVSNNIWSDKTLKENIKTIENPLAKLTKLRGVTFNYKKEQLSAKAAPGTVIPNEKPRTQIGLIAQEVEEVVPEAVTTADNGLKAVSYANLIALCIEAIKQQNTTIDSLKNVLSSIQENRSAAVQSNNKLYDNMPNPFNEKTSLGYYIENTAGKATIYIYNLQGEQLKYYDISTRGAGSLDIYGKEYKAGVYIYSLIVDGKLIDSKKMVLVQN